MWILIFIYCLLQCFTVAKADSDALADDIREIQMYNFSKQTCGNAPIIYTNKEYRVFLRLRSKTILHPSCHTNDIKQDGMVKKIKYDSFRGGYLSDPILFKETGNPWYKCQFYKKKCYFLRNCTNQQFCSVKIKVIEKSESETPKTTTANPNNTAFDNELSAQNIVGGHNVILIHENSDDYNNYNDNDDHWTFDVTKNTQQNVHKEINYVWNPNVPDKVPPRLNQNSKYNNFNWSIIIGAFATVIVIMTICFCIYLLKRKQTLRNLNLNVNEKTSHNNDDTSMTLHWTSMSNPTYYIPDKKVEDLYTKVVPKNQRQKSITNTSSQEKKKGEICIPGEHIGRLHERTSKVNTVEDCVLKISTALSRNDEVFVPLANVRQSKDLTCNTNKVDKLEKTAQKSDKSSANLPSNAAATQHVRPESAKSSQDVQENQIMYADICHDDQNSLSRKLAVDDCVYVELAHTNPTYANMN